MAEESTYTPALGDTKEIGKMGSRTGTGSCSRTRC